MTRIFVVRHGNTFLQSEAPRRIGARSDPTLSPTGIEQARSLGMLFRRKGIQFDRILASPLRRTRETASMIVEQQMVGLQTEVAEWLIEIDHGPDEGALDQDVVARIGISALREWNEHGTPPSDWDVAPERRIKEWRSFFAEVAVPNVLLVTSNGAARFALLAASLGKRDQTLRLRTGAYGLLECIDGLVNLVTWDERPKPG